MFITVHYDPSKRNSYNVFLDLQHQLKILEMQISDQMFQNLIGFGTGVINIIIAWRFVEQKLQYTL